jgi:hypothetical protein
MDERINNTTIERNRSPQLVNYQRSAITRRILNQCGYAENTGWAVSASEIIRQSKENVSVRIGAIFTPTVCLILTDKEPTN